MKLSFKKGLGFGLTSGVITTLGIVVGLNSGTRSAAIVIAGILVIAIADSFSDALGMHVSEETEERRNTREVWEATLATFVSKLIISLSFIFPVVLFDLSTAVMVSVAWGILLVAIFSYHTAKIQKIRPSYMIAEHLAIAALVIIATHYVGLLASKIG